MTPVLIVALVVGIFALQGVMWVLIIRAMRKQARLRVDALTTEAAGFAGTGEAGVRGPIGVGVRGGHTSGHATVLLTDRRLVVYGRTRRDIARATITKVRTARSFNGKLTAGKSFVILTFADGIRDLGLQVKLGTEEHWRAQLAQASAAAPAS